MRAGFASATSMIRGRASKDSNQFQLPRIPVNHHTLPHLLFNKDTYKI